MHFLYYADQYTSGVFNITYSGNLKDDNITLYVLFLYHLTFLSLSFLTCRACIFSNDCPICSTC